ncbi:MAG TPA: tetratricopeptide repeat protein [Acidimicrobiales bacterium]|nr:tetratricopeptide repeat protein [Acidimicrobiales bacterium]
MIRILLAGRVAVEADGVAVDEGGLGRLGRLALAYLVTERQRPAARTEVAELLWGDDLPRSWETSLRGVALRIRGVLSAAGLPAEVLTSAFGCWQLKLPPGTEVDVEVAAEDLARAEAALAAGGLTEAKASAERAAVVAGRGFLVETDGSWVERRQADLRELHLRALEALADADAGLADWAGALRAAEEAVSIEPFRESGHLRLMQAHAGAGNRGEALRAYERCRRVLAEELGVNPSPQTEAAYLELLGDEPPPEPAEARAPDGPADHRSNLPFPLTRLVGRDDELAEIEKALAGTRLLTLTGTGGVGKTRLSLAAAAELAPGFADGAFLVELAPLADPDLVPQQVLAALGLREEPGQAPLASLAAHLRARHALVVLDNCEHLVGPAAALAEALLRACPRLTVLATSREPLGVPGETTWRVPSLTPAGAVALFAERARAVRPDFEVTDELAPVLAQLCQRLDNIPLALELAAARTSALSVEEIASRLDDRFRLLSGGARTAVPRQQTLRAMVDWTYDALSEVERRTFDRLAVFGSSFALEAAEQVAGGDGVGPNDVLDVLTGLVDKSLVVAERGAPGRPTRFRLLETMRHYARERLAESGDAAAVRSRHLDRAVAVAQTAEAALDGPEQAGILDQLEAEHDDFRVALAWGTSGGDPEPALRLATALGRFWEVRGHLREGRSWLEAALVAGGGSESPALRATALNWAAVLAQHQGDYAAARGLYEHSLALRRRLDEPLGVAAALVGLGNLAALQGDLGTARSQFEEAAAIGRDLDQPRVVAAALTNLGWVAHADGDVAGARALYEDALAARRQIGDGHGTALVLANLGDLALQQGDLDTASALQTEGLDLRRRLGDRSGVGESLAALGRVALARGDRAAARALHGEGLAERRRLGDRPGMPPSLTALAELARLDGDPDTAAALLEEALAVATELDDRHCMTLALLHLARLAIDQGEPARADALYRQASPVAEDGRVPPTASTAVWLEGLAAIAVADGRPERAARLLGAADALRQATGTPLPAHEAADRNDAVAGASAALGEAAFRSAFAEGRAMPLAEAARLAASSPG